MPKHNRTKRVPKYNNNSNAESVNIGFAPGIRSASIKGLNNNRKIKNFRSNNSNNNTNLQNSNFYQNVGNFPVNKNSDYDVIYKSLPKISTEDLYEKIYRKIVSSNNNNKKNNNYNYDSLQQVIYVFHHPEESNTLNEFWYSVFLRLQALAAINEKVDNEVQALVEYPVFTENEYGHMTQEMEAYQDYFDLDLSNMNLIEIAFPLEKLNEMRKLNCENNRIEKIPRLPMSFVYNNNNNESTKHPKLVEVNFDNNPLTEPYLSIYKKYRETDDIQEFIRRVNQEHTSELLEKIPTELPTNVTRHIAKFVEGGKRKRKSKTRKHKH